MSITIKEYTDFIIAEKGIQNTVPLKNKADGTSLLEQIAVDYPEVMKVCGKNPWEGGALHRLDHDTTGAVLFARNQKFYDYISSVQDKDLFVKYYTATCNVLENAEIEKKRIVSYFRAFGPKGRTVKPVDDVSRADSDRLYRTDIEMVQYNPERCTFLCKITRGFRHQIRAHLASIGCPIVGDKLYNEIQTDEQMMLRCTGFEFPLEDGTQFVY